jgi:hypothetical protein
MNRKVHGARAAARSGFQHAARSASGKPQTDEAVAPGLGHRNAAVAWLPWVYRAADLLMRDGPEAVAMRQRPHDEQLAILQAVIELLAERPAGVGPSWWVADAVEVS